MLNCHRGMRIIRTILTRKMSTVHATAVKGFTAKEASMYNQGRPSYSEEALDLINQILSPPADNSLVLIELGAGTGKFTKAYAKQLGKSFQTYTAIEPSEGFRSSLAATAPLNVAVADGTGSNISAVDHACDGVLVAQAFHWMATESTLKEIHRVLRPNRPLILIWNTYDYSKAWLRQIDEEILTPSYGEGVPRQQDGKWRDCFSTQTGRNLFGDINFWHSHTEHVGTDQLMYDRILSTSVIAEKSEEERAAVRRHITRILDAHPELDEARRTNTFSIPYITEIAWVDAK